MSNRHGVAYWGQGDPVKVEFFDGTKVVATHCYHIVEIQAWIHKRNIVADDILHWQQDSRLPANCKPQEANAETEHS